MMDLGVKVLTGKTLSTDTGLTLDTLKKDGYEVVFLGFGKLLS
jgi:hypothetical protein